MNQVRAIAAAAGVVAVVSLAGAQVRVVYSNLAGHATSLIPNGEGRVFDNGTATQFDRPHVSPDGRHFILIASYDAGASEVDNEIVVVGELSPLATNAGLVVLEGSSLPFELSSLYGTFIRTHADINDDGSFAISCDTTAATSADEMIVRYTAGTQAWDAPVREGSPVPFAGFAYPNFGSVNSDVNLLSDGRIAGRASTFTGTGGSTKQVLYIGSTIIGETDVTVPGGQLILPTQTVDAFTTTDRFRTDSAGVHWIERADLNGATTTDDIILVDGSVVAQEGAPLPGNPALGNVGVTNADVGSNQISPNGQHWVFRTAMADGTGNTATDVVIKNGQVAAKTDTLITSETGQTELFDDAPFATTFFLTAINDAGDIVVGGTTNAPDAAANAVVVLNGTTVVLRENDPVDLDGNGSYDDNVRISVFNNDDCFLTADRRFYFLADLRDDFGVALNSQAMLFIDLGGGGPTCDPDVNQDGNVDQDDVTYLINVVGGGENPAGIDPDFNADGNVDQDDVGSLINTVGGGGCP